MGVFFPLSATNRILSPDIQKLLEIAPQVPIYLLEKILTTEARGDLTVAAMYITENDVVAKEQERQERLKREAEAQTKKKQEEEENLHKVKKTILERYGEKVHVIGKPIPQMIQSSSKTVMPWGDSKCSEMKSKKHHKVNSSLFCNFFFQIRKKLNLGDV